MINESSHISASFNILESNFVPFHPGRTYVNFISKSQATNTLLIGKIFFYENKEHPIVGHSHVHECILWPLNNPKG